MIGKLTGRIDARFSDHVLIDVHGVGYVVHCSDRTLAALPGVGEFAAIYTELLVREDLLQLFGFLSIAEREWHRLLISVQGVGAKGALAIQGTLGTEGLSRAIAIGDWGAVKAAPGVGPKIAQRIVNELKGKAAGVMAMGGADIAHAPAPVLIEDDAQPIPAPATVTTPAANPNAQADALSALTNLGYGPSEAASAVAQAALEAGDDPAALIRAALRLLAPAG